jgi:hypothetical protein
MERQAYLGNAGLRLVRGSPLRIGYVVPPRVAGRMASFTPANDIEQINDASEPRP